MFVIVLCWRFSGNTEIANFDYILVIGSRSSEYKLKCLQFHFNDADGTFC